MPLLFTHIKSLLQVRHESIDYVAGSAMAALPTLENAYLLVENGKISAFGPMADCPEPAGAEVVDASGCMLLPSWCDAHTHLVYAGNREQEFIDRIEGLSYEEIARRGGGILHSAHTLEQASEAELYRQSEVRLREVIAQGTGAIEIKSGYGLTPEAELKMLRVIRRLKETFPLPIKATFLAAHALPTAFKADRKAFLDLMLEEVLPVVAEEGLADFIDVFCETGYFTVAETERILAAGNRYGLPGKPHVNQFTAIGGVAAGVKHHARSVDHLEVLRPEDIEALRGSKTMPVALPGCSLFLGIPYTPGRELIEAGLPIALATDYNPGSAPSGNMNLVVSLACIKMKLTPAEAINAATLNGAYAMGLEQEVGSITVGKRANLILTQPINSYGVLPYAFGSNHLQTIYLDGQAWN